MTAILPQAVESLLRVFGKLPGVGRRTAMRYVLHLIREGDACVAELARCLDDVARQVTLCPSCQGLSTDGRECHICLDPQRGPESVCIVAGIADLLAIEATGLYQGRYFVLHRLLSPLKGVGPASLGLGRLFERAQQGSVEELVLATPLTAEGETTATYVSRTVAHLPVRVTRLAAGVPVGGSIEYLDRLTLSRAFEDRKEL